MGGAEARAGLAGTTRERLARQQELRRGEAAAAQWLHAHGALRELADDEARLPAGWRATKDSYGRVFFAHGASGRASWVEPVAVQLPWRFRAVAAALPHLLAVASESQWVRVTLEADEDRAKLFTAVYHQVLDQVLADTHRFFAGAGAGTGAGAGAGDAAAAKGGDDALPTLTETHKRAMRLKVRPDRYIAFVEHALRCAGKRSRAAGAGEAGCEAGCEAGYVAGCEAGCGAGYGTGCDAGCEATLPGPKPRTPRSCAFSRPLRQPGSPCSVQSAKSAKSARGRPLAGAERRGRSSSSGSGSGSGSMRRSNRGSSSSSSSSSSSNSSSQTESSGGCGAPNPLRARSESPAARRVAESEPEPAHLSMAAFGSLQARAFRELRLKQLAQAKEARELSQSQFGRPEDAVRRKLQLVTADSPPQLPSIQLIAKKPPTPSQTAPAHELPAHEPPAHELPPPPQHQHQHQHQRHNGVEQSDPHAVPGRQLDSHDELSRTLAQIEAMQADLARLRLQPAAETAARSSRKAGAPDFAGEPLEQYLSPDAGEQWRREVARPARLTPAGAISAEQAINVQVVASREVEIAQHNERTALRAAEQAKANVNELKARLSEATAGSASALAAADLRERELLAALETVTAHLQEETQRGRSAAVACAAPCAAAAAAAADAAGSAADAAACTTQAGAGAGAGAGGGPAPGELLARLTSTHEQLRAADEARLRAERRAAEASERVSKLSQSLQQQLRRSEVDRAEVESMRRELALCQESLAEGLKSRDALMDDLRSVRESSFVSLEAERVERASLGREITALRLQLAESRRGGGGGGATTVRLATVSPGAAHGEEAKSAASPRGERQHRDGKPEKRKNIETEARVALVSHESGCQACVEQSIAAERKAAKLGELERELFDSKCSLSRLGQRLKQGENEAAALRYELKATRQVAKSAESKLEARLAEKAHLMESLASSLRESEAAALRAREEAREGLGELDEANKRIAELEARASALETLAAAAQTQVGALRRDHEQTLAQRQHDAEAYRAGLEQHYARCKAVWEREHQTDVERARLAHGAEMRDLGDRAREELRQGLKAQRADFALRVGETEARFASRSEEQAASHQRELGALAQALEKEWRAAVEAAVRAERERARQELDDSYVAREVEAVKLRRRASLTLLHKNVRQGRVRELAVALARWSRATSASRANDVVEAYGAAIDRSQSAARLALTATSLALRAKRRGLELWKMHTQTQTRTHTAGAACEVQRSEAASATASDLSRVGPGVSPVGVLALLAATAPDGLWNPPSNMYPAELSRRIRRKMPGQRLAAHAVAFVEALELNLDGKVQARVFHTALAAANAKPHTDRAEFLHRLRLLCATATPLAPPVSPPPPPPPQHQLLTLQQQQREQQQREQQQQLHKLQHLQQQQLLLLQQQHRQHLSLQLQQPPHHSSPPPQLEPEEAQQQQHYQQLQPELAPSPDWLLAATCAVTRVEDIYKQQQRASKAQSISKNAIDKPGSSDDMAGGIARSSSSNSGSTKPESDFIRGVEVQALQEQVRALHVQLGQSKAEAWRYKRKLLSEYLTTSVNGIASGGECGSGSLPARASPVILDL
jgi:hypothetical protein